MGWLWNMVERVRRSKTTAVQANRSDDAIGTEATDAIGTEATVPTEIGQWNRLGGEGWVARWQPATYSRRRDWMWVRRQGDELMVFPGSQDRPRVGAGPHFRLNGDLVIPAAQVALPATECKR